MKLAINPGLQGSVMTSYHHVLKRILEVLAIQDVLGCMVLTEKPKAAYCDETWHSHLLLRIF
jgi:hypothetical protein